MCIVKIHGHDNQYLDGTQERVRTAKLVPVWASGTTAQIVPVQNLSRCRAPKLPALRQKTQLYHDASPNTVSQHSVVLPSRRQHSRRLIDSLSCQAHPPADPNPQCLDPRQPGQQCRRRQKQKTSWSRSLLRPRQDFRTGSQRSKTAWKGQALVPGRSDAFDRQARPEGFRQLVSASGGGAITFCAPPNSQETA